MTTSFRASLALGFLPLSFPCPHAGATEVAVCTDHGDIRIELLEDRAPLHVQNFLRYAEQGFYSGTVFHRVLRNSIVQGGGYDRQLQRRETLEPVENESRNGVSNLRGTVAAARAEDPDSATAQFFFNVSDNADFDASERRLGYTVFGRVISGLEVVDAISRLPTGSAGALRDVPEPIVTITSIAPVDEAALRGLPAASREQFLRDEVSAATDDPVRALELVGHLRAICAPLAAEVLLAEARAAAALDQARRARYVLDEYFRITDTSDPGRADAENLYTSLSPEAQPGVEPLVGRCIVPNLPPIPDGESADMDAMLAGQAAVRSFLEDSEMYLDCLSQAIDEDDIGDVEHANAVRQHNQMVTLMEELAEDFNREVRAFKERGK